MAILNGTEIKVYSASATGTGTTNLVAFAQNGTLNIEHSPREITNKESAGYSEVLEGLRSWTIELDGAYCWASGTPAVSTSNGADVLVESEVLNARTKFAVAFGGSETAASKDVRYWGEAYITSWSVTSGTEDTSTYSISLQGTGTLTQVVTA
tara:strand:+ start:380 stop:838 length:459 start_codon:yes stop_codon:yes gene_type:complete